MKANSMYRRREQDSSSTSPTSSRSSRTASSSSVSSTSSSSSPSSASSASSNNSDEESFSLNSSPGERESVLPSRDMFTVNSLTPQSEQRRVECVEREHQPPEPPAAAVAGVAVATPPSSSSTSASSDALWQPMSSTVHRNSDATAPQPMSVAVTTEPRRVPSPASSASSRSSRCSRNSPSPSCSATPRDIPAGDPDVESASPRRATVRTALEDLTHADTIALHATPSDAPPPPLLRAIHPSQSAPAAKQKTTTVTERSKGKTLVASREGHGGSHATLPKKQRPIVRDGVLYGLKGDQTLRQLLASDPQIRRLHHEANRLSALASIKSGDADDAADDSSDEDPWQYANIRNAIASICSDALKRTTTDETSLRIDSAVALQPAAADGSPFADNDVSVDGVCDDDKLLVMKVSEEHADEATEARRRSSTTRTSKSPRRVKPPTSRTSWEGTFTRAVSRGGVFSYNALEDPHCQSFHGSNRAFQDHWRAMQSYLQPNQRAAERVSDAMSSPCNGSGDLAAAPHSCSRRAVETPLLLTAAVGIGEHSVTPSRNGSARRATASRTSSANSYRAVPGALRATELTEQDTSVAVSNARTFFNRRREHLSTGLPAVVRNPMEAVAEQLKGPGGTMKASAGEPWPPERLGPPSTPKVLPPRPPSRRISSANASPHRPSTATSQPASSVARSRPASSNMVTFTTPSRIGSAPVTKFNARSPFLSNQPLFTEYDAQYFPDARTMREGTAPPSPYVFSAEFAQRPRSSRRPQSGAVSIHGDGSDAPLTPLLNQKELAAKATESLDILTETHINIICRCEDYGRRDLQKREAARFTVIVASYTTRSSFYLARHRQRSAIADSESEARSDIETEADVQLLRVLHQGRKDFVSARLSEEVFPKCPLLRKHETMGFHGEDGEHDQLHFVVDLRWAGNELDAASLSILVFDNHDRWVTTVSKGDSLRCPVSGRAVVRSWNNYKFRSLTDVAATAASPRGAQRNSRVTYGSLPSPKGSATGRSFNRKSSAMMTFEGFPVNEIFTPPECRSTYEILLGNLHPSAPFRRFVFVVSNPVKTGGLLSLMHRPYLTVRSPISEATIPLAMQQPRSGRPPLSSSPTSQASTQTAKRRIQADTRVVDNVAIRLPDRPSMACYTVASFVRNKSNGGRGQLMQFTALSPMVSEFHPQDTALSPTDDAAAGPQIPAWGNFSRPSSGRQGLQSFVGSLPLTRPNSGSQIRSPHDSSLGDTPFTPDAHAEWQFVCHDHGDASVPNLLRLPQTLEATLFVDEVELWINFVTHAVRIERSADESFQKIFRQVLELQEMWARELLDRAMRQEKEAAEQRSTRSALAEAMIKNAYTKSAARRVRSSSIASGIDPLAASSVLLPIAENAPMDVSLRRQQSSLKMAAVLVGRARAAKNLVRRKSKPDCSGTDDIAELAKDDKGQQQQQ